MNSRSCLPPFIGFLYILLVLLPACTKAPDPSRTPDPGFTSYIAAYTSGRISRKDRIRIRLSAEYTEEITPDEVIGEKLFSFKPSVRGITYWVDRQTLEFKPETAFEQGTEYEARFALSKLLDVPSRLKSFPFGFQTIEQKIDIRLEKTRTMDPSAMQWLYLEGQLAAADVLENERLVKLLKAGQDGRSLPLHWEFDPDGRVHHFRIDSIERKASESSFTVEWKGSQPGPAPGGKRVVTIPALGDFKLMEASVVQYPEQYIRLHFSDPLRQQQYLEGLITLSNGTDLSFTIENNVIRAYPSVRQSGNLNLRVFSGIRNVLGNKLPETREFNLTFEEVKPAVRLLGNGSILPSSEGMILPFEAVNLRAVEVRIIRIYENNIAQFLQVNRLNGNHQLRRVGRLIRKKTLRLDQGITADIGNWNAYSLDLNGLIETDPGAIYRVEFSFSKQHSLYPCDDDPSRPAPSESPMEETHDDGIDSELSYWDSPGGYYDDRYPYYYNWDERDDPCSDSYYGNHRKVARNVLASDLGIIAKAGTDHRISVAVSDLRTAQPVGDVEIEIFNYQQQSMGVTRTSADGIASVSLARKPFLLIARNGTQRGYLRLDDGSSLSLGRFDVSGNQVQEGVKAFIYGDRGVWRPGDTLFLTFMLEDREQQLPPDHPVSLELVNPRGQVVQRMNRNLRPDGFTSFIAATHPDALTGTWTGRFQVGGRTFSKWLRIETVKPNRLKINLDFGAVRLSVSDPAIRGDLRVNWLHGAPARNLRAHVAVTLKQVRTMFEGYEDFVFDDPVRPFDTEEHTLFDGKLEEDGTGSFATVIPPNRASPGMLRATFTTRVFEESGEFSIDRTSLPYSPYASYVGLTPPGGDKARGMLLTDTSHSVEVVTLDPDGNAINRDNLDVKIYKVNWRWWWETGSDNLASYISNTSHEPVFETRLSTRQGKGSFQFRVDYPEWGRYLIRIMDPISGHATGKIVYLDWPGWAGRAGRTQPGGAAMLSFSADKTSYQSGEYAEISIPSAAGGRALVSIENGSRVLETYWIETTGNETRFNFRVKPEMAPNIYVNVSLVQPHATTQNDLPIRLYGVIPLLVEDPATRLSPRIEMPDVLRPESTATIRIREANQQACTYTLAMVDEGLLDLTRFATPDPWQHFYAKEALGVKTWDMYDAVLGAYGGRIEQIFGIGGGFEEDGAEAVPDRANRFKPMVKFLGPFRLNSGATRTHEIHLPKYVGSVRTMVVAGNRFAYGAVDKTTPVKSPLMVLATLPRVLGPGETVSLPVTVFAMEEHVKNVEVRIKPNEYLLPVGIQSREINFAETGDRVLDFPLKVASKTGIGKVRVEAVSGNETASYEIELDIRNPNPPVSEFLDEVLDEGEKIERSFAYPGMPGSNSLTLEVSGIPPIDFGRRLKYLLRYPHGCIEQTTSAAFPQLFLGDVMETDEAMRNKTTQNIQSAIKRLHSFQLPSGAFAYWPGSSQAGDWSTSYAGHFLIESERKGFVLPVNMKNDWLKYQKRAARRWQQSADLYSQEDLLQAYRLYTLALAGEAALGAMNRLKEREGLGIQARWRLASAYALAGQQSVAAELLNMTEIDQIQPYSGFNRTYGSRERDRAMMLETLTLMNRRNDASGLVRDISGELRSRRWMSTQTTAYCLLAMSKFAGAEGTSGGLKFNYTFNEGETVQARTARSVAQISLDAGEETSGRIRVENHHDGILFVRLTMSGTPPAGEETAAQRNMGLKTWYTDMEGRSIDVSRLLQGTDFLVHVRVANPMPDQRYKDMALTQVFPSGWEIHPVPRDGQGAAHQADVPVYQDIRDDRVYTYFNITPGASNEYVLQLNAAYQGKYYLPALHCEAMYDESVNALMPGRWVEIIKPQ